MNHLSYFKWRTQGKQEKRNLAVAVMVPDVEKFEILNETGQPVCKKLQLFVVWPKTLHRHRL